ncbi:MAG TPA: plastocyanin/azurin family copper-binding protein [Candidatus Limnocylindrales bacterium]|nr:plastocyanin/azurin family copper-binding protein [Candidatus Limnocylindrales bacterium]
MHRFARLAVGALTVVALSACSGSGGAGGSQAAAPGGCTVTTATGTVEAGVADFQFNPTNVTAKVGDVITWKNSGPTDHTVTLDAGGCDTGHITTGSSASLTFTQAGTYPFHCSIHSSMKGTITITG